MKPCCKSLISILFITGLIIFIAINSYAQRCLVEKKYGTATDLYNLDGSADTSCYIVVGRTGNYGISDARGNLVIPADYDMYFTNCKGKIIAKHVQKKMADLWDLKTKTKVKLPGISAGDATGDNGLIAVQTAGNKWGYCNEKGKMVIPARFDYAERFTGNKAITELGGKHGIINEKGEWVVQPKKLYYRWVTPSLLIVQAEDKEGNLLYGLADNTGKILLAPDLYTGAEERNGFIEFKIDNQKGALFNYSGRKLTGDDCHITDNDGKTKAANGLIEATDSNGFVFVIDTNGKRYLEKKYVYIYRHTHNITHKPTGLYTVQTSLREGDKPETYAIVKLDGSIVLDGPINDVINYDENIFFTAVETKSGSVYDMKRAGGTILATSVCNEVAAFHHQYAFVRKDNKCGAINMQTGEWAIPLIYADVTEVNDCTIKFTDQSGKDVFFSQDLKMIK